MDRTQDEEKAYLAELETKPIGARIAGYAKLTGPGYLQSAMTLGGGTIASCVLMASLVGYELMWVQPIAILLGVGVLSAVAKQTCATGEPSYDVFWQRLHPIMALAWGIAALIATVLWHIPQYGLTANGAITLVHGFGLDLDHTGGRWGVGVLCLGVATGIVYLYNQGARGLKLYETLIKVLVWSIILAFAVVVFATGVDVVRMLKGVTGIAFIQLVSQHGGVPTELVGPMVGALAAAVGINMVFLYPYSLLSKNWGKEHTGLAYFDLGAGMVIPFLIATALMMMAVANTIGPEAGEIGAGIKDMREIIPVLEGTLGSTLSYLLIGLGMFAIGFSTIVTHMLAAGFIGCELFGMDHKGKAKFAFALLPAVGVIGVGIKFPFYAAVTASVLAAPLMPLTVIGFLILLNSKRYLGEDKPTGRPLIVWNVLLSLSAITLTAGAYFGLKPKFEAIFAPAEEAEAAEQAEPAADDAPAQEDTAWNASEDLNRFTATHEAMGTDFEFILYGTGMAEEMMPVADAAFLAVDNLEDRISSWKRDSLTSKINREAADGPVYLGGDHVDLLEATFDIHADTGGAFDITVGPLIELWGFYRKEQRLPSADELKQTLETVGLNRIAFDAKQSTIQFNKPGLRIDFGGIGKGLALDRAAEVLRARRIERGLLHGGTSTVLAMAAPPGAEGWTVGIKHPYNQRDSEKSPHIDEVLLANAALSTSTTAEKFFEVDGKRYGHIFDPRTGWPVEAVLSATAIAPTAMLSDALSTAFFVLGVDGTRDYVARHPEVKGILVVDMGNEVAEAIRIGTDNGWAAA